MLRLPAFGLEGTVARPRRVRADDGADHRHGVADRVRRRTADHPGRRGRPDGRARTRALALVAALEHRARTGEGQLVEMAMVEVAAAVTAEQVIDASVHGTVPAARRARRVPVCRRRPRGSRSTRRRIRCRPRSAPSGARTRRRRTRPRSCGRRDPGRRRGARPTRCSTIRSSRPAVLPADRPSRRRPPGVPDVADADVGRARRHVARPAPTLGQDTDDVLRELGVTDEELPRLRAEHVIGDIPFFG